MTVCPGAAACRSSSGYTPGGPGGTGTARTASLDDLTDHRLGHAISGLPAGTRRHRPLVGVDAAVSQQVHGWIEHLTVKLAERQALLPRSRRTSSTTAASCRVAPARYHAGAPSEPYVHVVRAYGSSKPRRDSSGVQNRWVPARAGCPAVAGDVHEAGAARRFPRPASGQVVPGDRFAGGGEPLLPLTGAGWFPVGV